jgi:hypothetical protein
METMRRHLLCCQRCSRHDTVIRRSLLVVRNLPTIEPSADFVARLNARLQEIGPPGQLDPVAPRPTFFSLGAIAALAAGIMAVGYVALETTRYFTPSGELRVQDAVVAVAPDTTAAPMPSAAFVASVPTGMTIWPAVLMVGNAQAHFASMEFRGER